MNDAINSLKLLDSAEGIESWYLENSEDGTKLLTKVKRCCESVGLDCDDLQSVQFIITTFLIASTGGDLDSTISSVKEAIGRKIHDNPFMDNAIT